MTLVIPDGFCQITYIWGGPGMPLGGASTLGAENTGALSAADAVELAKDALVDNLLPRLTNNIDIDIVRVKLGPNETGAFAEQSPNLPGAVNDSTDPPNVSFLISKQTALGGRKGRGRMFFPSLDKDLIDQAGNVTSAELAEWVIALGNFRDDLIAGGLTPVLLHSDATTPTPITAFAPQAKAATQRRRLRR